MEPDQLDDPVLYRQELIKTHSRRLKALEIKASKYGLETPVSIEVEIVEIKEKIAALGGEIDDIKHLKSALDYVFKSLKDSNDANFLHMKNEKLRYIKELNEIHEKEGIVDNEYTRGLIAAADQLTNTLIECNYPIE